MEKAFLFSCLHRFMIGAYPLPLLKRCARKTEKRSRSLGEEYLPPEPLRPQGPALTSISCGKRREPMVDPLVSLKGVGDGLRLHIGSPLPKEQILSEITPLFDRIRQLASGARITVDACGKEGELVSFLRDFLVREYQVADVAPADMSPGQSQQVRKRQREADRSWENRRSDVLMMCGRVRSGQKIQHKGHVLLMGDVNPGGEVMAGGDIIVLGSLCGSAAAGHPEKNDAIIVALDFRPTRIQIADQVSTGPYGSANRSPHYACIREGAIVVAEYLDQPPFAKLPWPEPR
jgi:septum site-determining protein MinC